MLPFQISRKPLQKIRSHLANMITLLNLCAGSMASMLTINQQFQLAVVLILIASLLDYLDGMIARKLGIQSDFGKQLDSMSDIISFGVAPGLLLYQGILHEFGAAGMFLAIFYIGCGAFRLARFNTSDQNEHFIGLPITAAGLFAALSTLLVSYVSLSFYLYFTIFLSFMMVSSLKVKKFR